MGSTAGADASQSATGVGRLGFATGHVVQELGYGDDVDLGLRSGIEEAIGAGLEDEDYDDVIDGVVLWWRSQDGDVTDLTDALVDARAALDDGGLVWLFSPKPGRPGHVAHSEIEEAATTAGLHATSSLALAADWTGTRLGTRARGR